MGGCILMMMTGDKDESAIVIFGVQLATVDAIPSSLINTAEEASPLH
jgi:hypothetical protein